MQVTCFTANGARGLFNCMNESVCVNSEDDEAAKLLEEADMPLEDLLAQYMTATEEEEGEGEREG